MSAQGASRNVELITITRRSSEAVRASRQFLTRSQSSAVRLGPLAMQTKALRALWGAG